ncbi:MAG: VOC family protein [Actinomycetia bacterium]|nr:VOC family protein [Actinomycetes bacterium]
MVSSQLSAVTLDAHDPARLGEFWASMLGREAVEHVGGVLLPGDHSQHGLRFVTNPAAKIGPNLAHFHLTSTSAADQQHTVAMALDLGARHLDFGQTPDDGHIVLADPDGNEFCVIEPGNNFLANCGFLGELACDGPRDVGLFWSNCLDWPLVWDQGQETAIQSPDGGTKISWGGEPAAPPEVRRRHRLYLVTAEDRETEADRLVSIGATRLEGREGRNVVLADPGGNEFELASQ